MSTTVTVTITERRGDHTTTVNVEDNVDVILVRDGEMSHRSPTARYLLPARSILATVTMRDYLDGRIPGDEDEINVAIACTSETDDDGTEWLVPFSVL